MRIATDIQGALLERARRYARRVGRPLRAIAEEGLRRVLSDRAAPSAYELPDASVGDPCADDPLEGLSWQDLRDEIHGAPRPR